METSTGLNPDTVFVGDRQYSVEWWQNGRPLPVPQSRYVGLDTETEPIVRGAPPVHVLTQVCFPKLQRVFLMWGEETQAFLQQLHKLSPLLEYVMHNAPFDLKICQWHTNQLWQAFCENRVTDTGIRFILRSLDEGEYSEQWGLEHACKRLLHVDVSKAEQLSFRHGQPLTAEQQNYAALDPVLTCMLREQMPSMYPTEDTQRLGHLTLSVISDNGLPVDREYMERLRTDLTGERKQLLEVLDVFGWRPGEEGNSGRLQEILLSYESRYDIKLPRTPKSKKIQAKKDELLGAFEVGDPDELPLFIRSYLRAQHLHKLETTYLNAELIGVDGRVHPFFHPCRKTGRTSCSGPNIQNMPRKENIRGIYMAPPGWAMCSADYSQLELCALAHDCLINYGRSALADLINAGYDVPEWFGKRLAVKNGLDIDQLSESELSLWRDRAKVALYGLPGGLGKKTFVVYARGSGVKGLTEDDAEEMKAFWLDTFPEMRQHLSPVEDRRFTARNVTQYCRQHSLPDNIKEVSELTDFLISAREWDEDLAYKETRNLVAYEATTATGRRKRNCTYCAACNLKFQGLAADGAKRALWDCYLGGHYLVNFIHDENIALYPVDDQLQNRVRDLQHRMERSMQQVLYRISNIKTKAVLMRRWHKKAKPVFDANGNLLIWEPGMEQRKELELYEPEEETS